MPKPYDSYARNPGLHPGLQIFSPSGAAFSYRRNMRQKPL